MILSASRRTDIPTFYSEWFFNRIKEGFLVCEESYECASDKQDRPLN